jgi:hypothetical protein
MGYHSKHKTTVTAGGGYQNRKTTKRYDSEAAPINYQNNKQSMAVTDKEPENIPPKNYIVLESEKPKKELNIPDDFLNSIASVYISGNYAIKGYVNLRIKQIIALLIQNTGGYHIVVNPQLRQSLLDIIQYGNDSLLGRSVSEYERNRIISFFTRDNR